MAIDIVFNSLKVVFEREIRNQKKILQVRSKKLLE